MMTGVILAGGRNRRMEGQPKGLLPFGNDKLIIRQLKLMQPVCSELIVVTNDPKQLLRLLDPEIRIITDFVTGRGPVGGLHAGLSLARNRDVWVVGSHMPFVSAKAAELLKERRHQGFEAAVPWIRGGVYPLHGVYDRECAKRIWPLLQAGEVPLTKLLKEFHWGELGESAFLDAGVRLDFVQCFHTPAEYENMLRLLPNHDS